MVAAQTAVPNAVAFQAFGNLLLAGVNPRITECSQLSWVALPGYDGPHDRFKVTPGHLTGFGTELSERDSQPIRKLNDQPRPAFLPVTIQFVRLWFGCAGVADFAALCLNLQGEVLFLL